MPFQKNKSFQTLLKKAAVHLRDQKPFVLFKYPDEDLIKAIFQGDDELITAPGLEQEGFVFGPFGDEMPVVLLRPDQTSSVPSDTDPLEAAEPDFPEVSPEEKEAYKRKVSLAVATIEAGIFRKVVLSRRIEVSTSKSPEIVFRGLISHYPSAFCYCWYHPAVGCWIGATPETLLHAAEGRFRTVSLAGTLKVESNSEPIWGAKEKEEQQIVTDYVSEVLRKKGIEAQVSPVETVTAGSLWHLKTTISGALSSGQVGSLVKALHPTPAVCGIPLAQAKAFLQKYEGYSRTYYTGFLGEMNPGRGGETRLFVNLRCAEITGSKAVIYVGGGITAHSDPDQEWEETQAKSRTVLRVL